MRYLDALCAGLLAAARCARPLVERAARDDADAAEALPIVDAFINAADKPLSESWTGPLR